MCESIYRSLVATIRKALILGLVLSLFLAPCLVTPAAAQSSPLPGVQLDCGSDDPVMDVSPSSDAEISVACTVTNPTSSSEEIRISETEWDGGSIEMTLSEDTFVLAAGEEDTFQILFKGQNKILASEKYSFEIEAKIVSWNGISVEEPELLAENLIANATHRGELNIEVYGLVELKLSDVTTRYMQVNDEVEFSFQVTNKGNADDTLEIVFANAVELEAAGFSFPGGTLTSEKVKPQEISSVKTLTIRAPSDVSSDLRMPLLIRAQSTIDDAAPFSEINIQIDIKASSKSGGIDGLDALSSDDTLLYASIGGGVLLTILFLVVLVRVVSKKKPKKQSQPKLHQPIILPDEPVELSGDEEFDDLFSDLDDETVKVDEFDDLLDEF
jgi:hypothetical protein